MTQAYPLQWPHGKPRTPSPKRAIFKAGTFEKARIELMHELKLLGATDFILSTNLALRLDGFPYSNRAQPVDKGVAIYFNLKRRPMVFSCDRWDRIEDNLRALTKTIEAIRGLERWGGGSMVEQAFAGFAALPAPSARDWWRVIGCEQNSRAEVVRAIYLARAKELHPDNGGNPVAMAELTAAWEACKRERLS